MNRPSIVIPLVLAVNALWAFGQTFWKRAIGGLAGRTPLAAVQALVTDPNFYAGGFISTAGVLIWLFVLSKADLSYATPIAGLGIVFVAVFSAVILHEPVGAMRLAGTVVIAIGIALVARS